MSEETCADKAREFIERGHLGREQQGKRTQENCSATWLAVLGFRLMGLVSRLSLANHLTQSPSWWHTHHSAKMDDSKGDSGRWTDTRFLVLISQILLAGGGLLVLYPLPGPHVVKQLMQVVTGEPGQGGRFQSVCFP